MDETTLQQRLTAIERRQFFILALIVAAYVLGGVWIVTEATAVVTPWIAGMGGFLLVVLAVIVAVYRRRHAR